MPLLVDGTIYLGLFNTIFMIDRTSYHMCKSLLYSTGTCSITNDLSKTQTYTQRMNYILAVRIHILCIFTILFASYLCCYHKIIYLSLSAISF